MNDDVTEVSEAAHSVAKLLVVDPKSSVPLYKQLTDGIVDCIETTRLMPGQLMPSSRELSKACKVSRKTIMRVYDDLMNQGYLKSVEGVGTFINKPLVADTPVTGEQQAIKLSHLAKRIMQLPTERLSCGFFPELNNGAAPADMLPINQWRKLMLTFSREQTVTESNFVDEPFGYRPLREAICSYVLRKRGIRCTADQVVLFLDAMYSMYAAAQLVIGSGDLVAMEAAQCLSLRGSL
jgi:GntR family transcriptional regulator/MocR family aminotransferase